MEGIIMDNNKYNGVNYNHKYSDINYTFRYNDAIKTKKIDETLNKLHSIQLDMIDELVNHSNLQEAKEVILKIMQK
jgi:hypothetical protein